MRIKVARVDVDHVRILEGDFIMSFFNQIDAWTRMEMNFRRQIMRSEMKRFSRT